MFSAALLCTISSAPSELQFLFWPGGCMQVLERIFGAESEDASLENQAIPVLVVMFLVGWAAMVGSLN
jgi:hypothetical protein